MRRAWWLGVHAVGGVGLVASGLPRAAALAAGAAVLAHAWLTAPAPPPLLLVTESGRWSVPARGLFGLELDERSAYTSSWARLELELGGRRARLVLLKAEYGAAEWRRIQLALRQGAGDP